MAREDKAPSTASAGRARGLRGQRVVADDGANEPSESAARAAGLHEVPEGRVAPEDLPRRRGGQAGDRRKRGE